MDERTTVLLPESSDEISRWEESARRRRMLDGTWGDDLLTYMAGVLNVLRTSSIGKPSRAINLYRTVVEQLAIHYTGPAQVTHDTDDDTADNREGQPGTVMSDLLARGYVWPSLRRHEEYVLGLRESLLFVGWSEKLDAPRLRLVTADTVVVTHAAGDPSQIVGVREARWRGDRQLWDVWSLEDPRGFWIENEKGVDLTAETLGTVPAWEWDGPEGRYLPWVVAHATYTGALWDPHAWCELVDGAFDVAVAWNNWHKVVRDASWRQRWGLGVTVQGGAMRGSGETSARHVTTAPDSVLLFESTSQATAGSLGSFDQPTSPEELGQAILQFSRTLLASVGIHPADVEKTEGNASSGYAIQLRRSAQRRLAQAAESMRRACDVELLTLIAREAGKHGHALPDDGWQIAYQYPDDGAAEKTEALALDVAMVEAGVLTPVDMYQRWHPGVSDDAAARALIEAAAQKYALAPENVGRLIADDVKGVADLRDVAKVKATEPVEVDDGGRDDGDERDDDASRDGE